MAEATLEKKTLDPQTILWGDPEEGDDTTLQKVLRGWEYKFGSAPQSLPGYRVGVATDRSAQEGVVKAMLGDQSGGVRPRPGIAYWQSDALRSHVRNEGWQTRAGIPSLPYNLVTQAAIPHVGGIDLDGLVAYWPLNESSGNALDASGNARTLTETSGTIDSAAGLLGNARDFELGDTEYFEAADDTWNSITSNLTFCAWVYMESKAAVQVIGGKYQFVGDQRSYRMGCNAGTGTFFAQASSTGLTAGSGLISIDALLANPAVDTWYFVCFQVDTANQLLKLRIDDEDWVEVAYTAGTIFDGTSTFRLGADSGGSNWDGKLQNVSLWNRVLTDAEVNRIYNAGHGSDYEGLTQPIVSEWNSLNIRRHEVSSSLGGNVFRYYNGVATNFLRNDGSGSDANDKSAIEAVSCNVDGAGASYVLPGIVTAAGHLYVNNARVLGLAIEDYGVVYTSDPTASTVVFTTLIDFDDGDRVDAMGFMEQLGPIGCNIFSGQIGGINSAAWWAPANMTADSQVQQVVDSTDASVPRPRTIRQTNPLYFSTAQEFIRELDLDDLESWWTLSASSGDDTDAHGSNTLTDTNTVTGSTTGGKGGAGYRTFTRANSEQLRVTDNASLSLGSGVAFSFAGWVYFTTSGTNRMDFMAKLGGAASEYTLFLETTGTFQAQLWNIAGTQCFVSGTSYGAVTNANWYWVCLEHDGVNTATMTILHELEAFDNRSEFTGTVTGGVQDSTGAFAFGAGGSANYHDGRMSEWVFKKGAVLTEDEKRWLFYRGVGRDYNRDVGQAWSNINNALVSDNTDAQASIGAGFSTSVTRGILVTGIDDPGIPDGAIITGIVIESELDSSDPDHVYVYEVGITVSGVPVGVARYPEQIVGTAEGFTSFGSRVDCFFANLTGVDAANLGAYIRFSASDGSETIDVDSIRMRIAYSLDAPARVNEVELPPVSVDKDSDYGGATISWTNATNIMADDNVLAIVQSITDAAGDQHSDLLLIGPLLPRGTAPSSSILTGLQIDLLGVYAENTDEEGQDVVVQLWRGGSLLGLNKAKLGQDWGRSFSGGKTNRSYGRDGDPWGVSGLSVDDLADTYLAIQVAIQTVDSGWDVGIDSAQLHVSWEMPGTPQSMPLGGYTAGVSPDEDSTLYRAVAPVDEANTILQPRQVKKLAFSWDTSGARPVGTVTRVNSAMNHVQHFNHSLGGIMVTGDHAGGPGRHVHLVSRTGAIYDQNFAGVHGTTEVRVNAIAHVQGVHTILDIVDSDYANRQFWTLKEQTYYADWLMQSKSERTISELPIASAETAIDLGNDRMYTLFPKDGCLAVARVFCPRDLNADPRLTDTTETRSMAWSGTDGSRTENTALNLFMGIIDFGPPEAAKAITQVSHHSYRVDDGTLYGGTQFSATVDGSVPDGSDAFNLSFGAGLGDQTTYAYDQYIAGAQDYRTLYIRLGGTHTAGTARSPDLGPFLMYTQQMWLDDELIYIKVDRTFIDGQDSEFQGFDEWREFAWKKPTRTLTYSGRQVLAQWVGWREGDAWMSLPALGSLPGEGPPLLAVWRRVPGTVDPAA